MGERVFDIAASDESITLRNRFTNQWTRVSVSKTGILLNLERSNYPNYKADYRWYNIVPLIKNMVQACLTFDETRPLPKGKEKCPAAKRREWQETKATKCVAKALTEEWRKLLLIPKYQKFINFDRKYSRVAGTMCTATSQNYFNDPKHDVWTQPYLYNDLVTYQPAMMLLRGGYYKADGEWSDSKYTRYNIKPQYYKDWKALFAIDNQPYKALNKTLLSVNYSCQIHSLLDLKQVKLPYSLETRAELLSWLSAISVGNLRDDIKEIVCKAKTKEIREAAKFLRENGVLTKTLRKSDSYYKLVQYLRDYEGEAYHGSILGLAKRSFEYHELIRQNRIKQRLTHDVTTPTVKPPFDFSSVNGATHLDTVQAVVDEGKFMGHCVASYANSAVKGQCFLFHIEHNKQHATVEIGSVVGEIPYAVRQSQGPANQQNDASKYAEKKFKELFKKLGEKKCKALQSSV